MKKELSTFQFMKKLFAPVWGHPIIRLSLIGRISILTLGGYMSVLLMWYIVKFMESKDYIWFENALIYLIGYYIFYEVINFFTRNEWRVRCWFPLIKIIHNIVIPNYLNLDNTHTEKIGTGKGISIIESWIYAWVDAIQHIIEYMIKFSFAIGLGIYFTIKVDIWYSIWYLFALVLLMIFIAFINKHIVVSRDKRRDEQTNRTRQLVRIIMSKFEILLSNKSHHETHHLDIYVENAQHYNIIMNRYLYLLFDTPQIFIAIFRISVYVIVWYGYFQWYYTLAELTTFISLILILDRTIMDIVEFYKNLSKTIANLLRLRNLLDTTPSMIWYTEWLVFDYQQWEISLKDISFSYSEWNPVFENFSLDIQWGKRTALVWLSGSGKTTLMKLISGYMRPDSGEILVDGQSLTDVSLQSYYDHIGYLTQEPSVFDGTIRENLLYGVKDWNTLQSEKDIVKAIEMAHCDFINQLPDGLDTEIGEKGIRLSGWQRQRLAIAKIFLKNPQLIFLDEPTSALDSLSEKLISDAFHNLFQHRAVVIIAHRLQTVKEADEIIVLGQNDSDTTQILERGMHKQLATWWWVYQEMLELQSGFNF